MTFHVVKVLRLASLLLCIALFCLLMSDIYVKYSNKLTSVGVIIEEYEQDEKDLPCLTLCPWKVFKKRGFHFKFDEFYKNVFEKTEIFAEQPGKPFVNTSLYTIEEIHNAFIGRCFMVCHRQPAKKSQQSYILLQRMVDMKGSILMSWGVVNAFKYQTTILGDQSLNLS